jgi:hypothetical protein
MHKTGWVLFLVAVFFIILRIPSLTEPHWYGDEGIYQVIGRAILHSRLLYQDIWDNKPPLLYLIYALVNGNLYLVKLLSLLSGLASVFAFYLLTGKLFSGNKARYVSLAVYSFLLATPLLEGNIANAENFMLLPVILAAYYIVCFSETRKTAHIMLSGLFLSIALFTKIVAVFDIGAFLVFLVSIGFIHKRKIILKPYLIFIFCSFSLIFLSGVWFYFVGAFKDFVGAVFVQNVSYVGEENAFIFPMGILIIKTILLGFSCLLLILNSSKLSKTTVFIYLWTLFGLYNAFFSDRPYTHYLLVLLPAFSLLFGHLLEYRKTKLINVFMILVISLIGYFHFQIYRRTLPYYENYLSFLIGNKSIKDYEYFFDANTPRDYAIANFIDMNVSKDESVFLWSDSPQIYALSNKLPIGKYVVAYHIKFYKNADIVTKEEIETATPKFIIQTVDGPLDNDILSSYQLRYIIEGAKIYERQI